jgi:hypothetical protein
VYACTLRIAGKRIDERLAVENVSECDAGTGQAGGGLGHAARAAVRVL